MGRALRKEGSPVHSFLRDVSAPPSEKKKEDESKEQQRFNMLVEDVGIATAARDVVNKINTFQDGEQVQVMIDQLREYKQEHPDDASIISGAETALEEKLSEFKAIEADEKPNLKEVIHEKLFNAEIESEGNKGFSTKEIAAEFKSWTKVMEEDSDNFSEKRNIKDGFFGVAKLWVEDLRNRPEEDTEAKELLKKITEYRNEMLVGPKSDQI